MNKTWLVLIHELKTTFTRPSFLIAAIGIPLVSIVVITVLAANRARSSQVINELIAAPAAPSQATVDGYVDLSGLIQSIPDSVPTGLLQAFPDEQSAKQALKAGDIRSYYLIPGDYLVTGKIILVRQVFNPLEDFGQSRLIDWILKVNLLNGDQQLARQIDQPLQLQVTLLEPSAGRDQNNLLTFFIPYAVTMVFYLIIMMPASLLLSSITKEKENRMLEMLMVSTSPRQMLTGKTLGLGLAGLFQAVIWIATVFFTLSLRGSALNIPPGFELPADFLAWGLIYFMLGYALYASLMAAVGALAPNLRESTQATLIILIPLMIPLMMISIIINNPNGLVAVAFSLFPLTAPITMITRLAAGAVPLWQLVLSVALLALTAVYINRLVAQLFRAQVLLSGQPFQLRRLLDALSGGKHWKFG